MPPRLLPPPSRLRGLPRSVRALAALPALALLGAGLPAAAVPTAGSAADPAPAPASVTISGRGFGHGFGMSQYGAYGAARRGLTWQQIMAFYYPGTSVASLPRAATIRVKIGADNDGNVKVVRSPGLTVTDDQGHRFVLPSQRKYQYWKVLRSGSSFKLQTHGPGETYRPYTLPVKLTGTRWTFTNQANLIRIIMPDLSSKTVRGSVSAAAYGSSMRTVNTLPIDSYLRSVVPSEMPTSWSPQAVRAQAVAARSFAARTKAITSRSALYDVCDTDACQVYRGYSTTNRWGSLHYETAAGDAAVAATTGRVLKYGSTIAFTQFASSNGGARAQGGYPYLAAGTDPYDGVVASQAWTRKISTASIARIWGLGTFRAIEVARRDGSGSWGGRVLKLKLVGSKRTVTVSGTSFQSTFGMRSNLFAVTG